MEGVSSPAGQTASSSTVTSTGNAQLTVEQNYAHSLVIVFKNKT